MIIGIIWMKMNDTFDKRNWKKEMQDYFNETQKEYKDYCKLNRCKCSVTFAQKKLEQYCNILDRRYRENFLLFDFSKHINYRNSLYREFIEKMLLQFISKDLTTLILTF